MEPNLAVVSKKNGFFMSRAEQPAHPLILADLFLFLCCVDAKSQVRDIAKIFNNNPQWPGVILVSQNRFSGMVSRESLFETLGKPYGIELYSRISIRDFYQLQKNQALVLNAQTPIQEAVKYALQRPQNQMYDPIVIKFSNNQHRLLNMHTLLTGQSMLLENLYNKVQKLSIIDPLTNIPNRRGFFENVQMLISDPEQPHANLSAFMIDIDHFKVINDIYGHFIGDCVIKAIVEECQNCLRQTDLLGRFGGEEFIALLPSTSIETSNRIAERLREKVQNLVVCIDDHQISATVSIGICHMKDTNGSLDKLLSQADQAMYVAKWRGRNQVVIWDDLLGQTVRDEITTPHSTHSLPGIWGSFVQIEKSRAFDETIEGWAHALELRDRETMGHAHRVSVMTVELARRIGIPEADLTDMRRGALLHDIGKIAIPDHILFKPGELSFEEWQIMRKHPSYALELLSPITYLQKAIVIPYCHHELWDGSGYPRGLIGTDIPLPARIFTIIDIWDALTSNRPYRSAWVPKDARQYLLNASGKLVDPEIVPVFMQMLDDPGFQQSFSALNLLTTPSESHSTFPEVRP